MWWYVCWGIEQGEFAGIQINWKIPPDPVTPGFWGKLWRAPFALPPLFRNFVGSFLSFVLSFLMRYIIHIIIHKHIHTWAYYCLLSLPMFTLCYMLFVNMLAALKKMCRTRNSDAPRMKNLFQEPPLHININKQMIQGVLVMQDAIFNDSKKSLLLLRLCLTKRNTGSTMVSQTEDKKTQPENKDSLCVCVVPHLGR